MELFYTDSYAIPFEEVKRLIDFFPYGSRYRIAVEILALTGCRVSELDAIKPSSFCAGAIIWKVGKNQSGYRKIVLPAWFIAELEHYLMNNNVSGNRLLPFMHDHLRTYLAHHVRHKLGGLWIKKRISNRLNGSEYVLQLKGLRHNYATLEFANELDTWGSTVALELVAKRMKHRSYKMTARHYIENFDTLDIVRYKNQSMDLILQNAKQKRLCDFDIAQSWGLVAPR